MTAESTAVCDQQTAEGRRSRGAQRLGRATDRRPLPPGSWWTTMRSSRRPARTLPAAPSMRAAPNPRTFTGWSGASPHVLRFPCGLSSGFPFARWALPLRPPSPGFPSSGVLRFVPFGRCPGSGSPVGFPRVPFPLSNLHVSAAARRFCRRGSLAAGTKVTSSAATTSPGSRDPPALQMAATGHDGMPPQNRLICAGARAMPSRLGPRASRRGESHPPPLSGPDVTVSRHPAPTVRLAVKAISCQWANRSGLYW